MQHKGFTLIELTIIIVLMSIITVVSSRLLFAGFSGYFKAQSIITLAAKGNVTMMRMSEELKLTGSFTSLAANAVSFTTVNGQSITYSTSGNSLNRSENAGSNSLLTDNLNAIIFTYYDKNLATTAVLASVRAVCINLTLQGADSTYPLFNCVYLENM